LLAERIRGELEALEHLVTRAEGAIRRASETPQDDEYFVAAAALDMHGFYVGFERLFELIAGEIDASRPSGRHWHRDLLKQMSLNVPGTRPAVLSQATTSALTEFLEFRHIVRNVYTFNLRPDRIASLVSDLRPVFKQAQGDLLAFCDFLGKL
jgi:hypothetical protein